jgi:penicillin amidase
LRAKRIATLLTRRDRHDVSSFEAMQADIVSEWAVEILPRMLTAAPQSTGGEQALDRLRTWDGAMTAGAAEPLIFAAWSRAFIRLAYSDELGDLPALLHNRHADAWNAAKPLVR